MSRFCLEKDCPAIQSCSQLLFVAGVAAEIFGADSLLVRDTGASPKQSSSGSGGGGKTMEAKDQWRVLEFYSGVGGMRYSLIKAGVNAQVVEAFDINDVANDVYEHNFGHRPYQGNIQSLTAADLDRYEAQAWLLSPPCQPYTRQGLQKQSGDARAFSFLRILELIPHLSRPPILLFVENVVGFEISDTHAKMIETLKSSGFVTQEFILSPLQFGVPYSRPRYFCLAKRNSSSFWCPCFNDKLIWCPSPLFVHDGEPVTDECLRPQDNWDRLLESCVPVEHFLEFKITAGSKTAEYDFENTNIVSRESNDPSKGHDERNGFSSTGLDLYHVPLSLIERWGSAMDIVYPDSRRCCCFTKSYYRYVKGTGSLLATVQPEMKGKGFPLKEQCLRYFTPRETIRFIGLNFKMGSWASAVWVRSHV